MNSTRDPWNQHQPPVQDGPSLVAVLVMVNVAAFLLQRSFSVQPDIPNGAISLEILQRGEWWSVFTHLFVHKGWIHLLCNMALLALAGPRVLETAGTRNFVYIYLLSGWIGAAATIIAHPASAIVGASGAIFGLLGTFAALFPEVSLTARIHRIFPWRLRASRLFWATVAVTAFLEVLVNLFPASEWNIPFLHDEAHLVHLAGLVTGWTIGRRIAPPLGRSLLRDDFFPQGLRRRMQRDEEAHAILGPSLLEENDAEEPPAARVRTDEEFLRETVDPVLDKLYASGMNSLTEAERAILDEAAKRFAKKLGA